MRIDPEFLQPNRGRPGPKIIALFALLFLFQGWYYKHQNYKAIDAAQQKLALEAQKTMNVIVAKETIQPGTPFADAKVAIEPRLANALPKDVITSFEVLKGKIAAGPIPAGNALSTAFLAEPVPIAHVEPETKDKPSDPLDMMLKSVEGNTVGLSVKFSDGQLTRGERIAILYSPSDGGDVFVIAEDVWVDIGGTNLATVRIAPERATIIHRLGNGANFQHVTLPLDGPSPYKGKEVQSADEILKKTGPIKVEATPKPTPETPKKKIKGHVWISGYDKKYTVDEDGNLTAPE